MPKFQYKQLRKMDPKPGRKFATTYYLQSQAEYNRLREHVYGIHAQLMALVDSELEVYRWWTTQDKSFPKSTKGQYYTPKEIVEDMYDQLKKQKDVPSGILGRWQKLFADTPYDIVMISGTPANETNYGKLFNYGQV